MKTVYPKVKGMSPLFVVDNLERSLNFYTQELGFEIDFRYEDFYAGIIRDIYTVHLKCGSRDNDERINKLENEHLDLCFSVENIDSLFESMKSRPVTIIQSLRQMPYGREFYIIEPDRYILGFLE